MSRTQQASRAARNAEGSKPVQWLGRFGDACYGLVYIVVAWLALQVAFGDTATQADQRGAVTAIAAQPFGKVLLWVVAVGLVAFAVWQLLAAAGGYQWIRDKRKRTMRRVSSAGRAVVMLAIASFTVKLLVTGSDGSSGDQGQQKTTATLLSIPGGQVIVFVIGLGVLVAAGVSGYRGIRAKFFEDLDMSGASAATKRTVRWLGGVGFVAKGVAYAVIGILLCVAAIDVDPQQAGGLDKALRTLAAQPFGVALLVAVAIGFVGFGVYCFPDARYRRG